MPKPSLHLVCFVNSRGNTNYSPHQVWFESYTTNLSNLRLRFVTSLLRPESVKNFTLYYSEICEVRFRRKEPKSDQNNDWRVRRLVTIADIKYRIRLKRPVPTRDKSQKRFPAVQSLPPIYSGLSRASLNNKYIAHKHDTAVSAARGRTVSMVTRMAVNADLLDPRSPPIAHDS